MSSSDDFASPNARFSGDDSSQFLDLPDVVRQSPLTLERVVDTQSGFLVVLKQIERKIALSVKRRVGTPPTSIIAFTPDESLQLSVILANYHLSVRLDYRQLPVDCLMLLKNGLVEPNQQTRCSRESKKFP